MRPDRDRHILTGAIGVRGDADRTRLEQAIRAVTARHASLRSVFPRAAAGPGPVRRELPAADVPIAWEEITCADAAVRDERLAAICARERQDGFDLAVGPLARWRIVSFDAGTEREHVIILTLHHIVADAWSFVVIARQLAACYGADCEGAATGVETTRGVARADAVSSEETEAYWRRHLQGRPGWLRLPRPAPPGDTGAAAAAIPLTIPSELSSALDREARRTGTTVFALLLAAGTAALSRWTGQRDFVVAVPVSSHTAAGSDACVGPFAHPLVLRLLVPRDVTLDLLRGQAHAILVGALRHHEITLARLLELARPARDAAAPLRLPVMISLLPEREHITSSNGVTFALDALDGGDQDVGVLIAFRRHAGGIDGELRCDSRDVEPASLQSLADAYGQALAMMVREPDAAVDRIPARPAPGAMPSHSVVVASTIMAEPLIDSFEMWSETLGVSFDVELTPPGPLFHQLLGAHGRFPRHRDGTSVLLLRASDLLEAHAAGDDRATSVETRAAQVAETIRAGVRETSAAVIVAIVPSLPEVARTRADELGRAEAAFVSAVGDVPGLTVLTPKAVPRWYPVDDPHDREAHAIGEVPFTDEYYAALGAALVRTLWSLHGPRIKIIAVDCDHVLWDGICGEDGPEGVTIDSGRRALQRWLVRQQEAGMLLCLCSKNNPADVWAVFDRRNDMPLGREHLAGSAVNWQPKPANLRRLAADLRIGLESVAFLDDNPIECAAMRAALPEVLTIELGADPARFVPLLEQVWAFDARAVSDEARARTAMYQHDRIRGQLRAQAPTLFEFLRDLHVQVDVRPLRDEDIPRASELTFRTTQFTTFARPVAPAELSARAGDPAGRPTCVTTRVRDRLGDYGLVGVALLRWADDALHVDGWSLSCRALGRSVEERSIAAFGQLALDQGVGDVVLHYRPGRRNRPARECLERLGVPGDAARDGEVMFRLTATQAIECVSAAEQRWAGPTPAATAAAAAEEPVVSASATDAVHAGATFSTAAMVDIARTLCAVPDIARAVARRRGKPLDRDRSRGEHIPPRTATERVVATVWAEMLNAPAPSVTDSFFERGGTSLLGVRLIAEIQRRLGKEIPIAALFTSEPTIAGLAATIDEREIETSATADVEALLGEIESLSDDEVKLLLAEGL